MITRNAMHSCGVGVECGAARKERVCERSSAIIRKRTQQSRDIEQALRARVYRGAFINILSPLRDDNS